MRQIHLVMPCSRPNLVATLANEYRKMSVVWHPITFQDEPAVYPDEPWIHPVVIPMDNADCKVYMPGCFKRNWFIKMHNIVDDDYYVTVDDDDMYEPGVLNAVRLIDDSIVIISMKRGHAIPPGLPIQRQHKTWTLVAKPENVKLEHISAQQSFVKGWLFKEHPFMEDVFAWDGHMAIHHYESGESTTYRPDLFALFNYYEPGRWVVE